MCSAVLDHHVAWIGSERPTHGGRDPQGNSEHLSDAALDWETSSTDGHRYDVISESSRAARSRRPGVCIDRQTVAVLEDQSICCRAEHCQHGCPQRTPDWVRDTRRRSVCPLYVIRYLPALHTFGADSVIIAVSSFLLASKKVSWLSCYCYVQFMLCIFEQKRVMVLEII